MFRLDGKIAFVSGGRGHLGQAMTRALADAGAHVLVNGREAQALNAFAEDLRSQGLSVEAVPFDAHDVSQIRGFFGGLKRLDVPVARRERLNLQNADLWCCAAHFTTWTLPLTIVASSSGFSVMP